MSDVGTRIPLPSRSLVRPPIDHRMQTTPPDPSHRPTGAEETETDPAQRITTDSSVVDPESHSAYGDAVREHPEPV